jgi:hypothetical protein
MGKRWVRLQLEINIYSLFLEQPIQDLFRALANNGDALRLLLIHFLSAATMASTDKRELFKLLQERDIDSAALKFAERLR